MQTESISKKEARKLLLSSQLLDKDRGDTLGIIEHLGYVQLDTISVVERAHHHTLWSRNSNYKTNELNDLMKKRKIFEYWSHAASVLPMSEYRYSMYTKKMFRTKKSSWFPKDKKMMNLVLKRIKSEGPLQSQDFKNEKKGNRSGWWDWKPAKKALERLFLDGELEVSYRDSFRKVYDLPENVIPSSVDRNTPTKDEFYEYLIQRTLRHHGFASVSEVGYLEKKEAKQGIQKVAMEMVEEGTLISIRVEGSLEKYYIFPSLLGEKRKNPSRLLLLSPFDNLVIQRKKLSNIFNFDYQIECYVPEKKRKFGYFSLPIFKGTNGIGRIDCKADRQNETLVVKSIHSENETDISKSISPKLKSFARFNGCKNVTFE